MAAAESVYYERPVLLDRDRHRRRRVKPAADYAFARRANSLHLAGVEFPEACKEYAIVFSRVADNGPITPVVLLGLCVCVFLFIADNGQWQGQYVPAFARRYPFVLASLAGRGLAVCIDEAYAGLSDTEGEPLFDVKGGETPYLQNTLQFLRRYQEEYERTAAFCRRLEQLGILMEMSARADLVDGRSFSVAGIYVVDERKLMQLQDSAALALFRAGELHLISMHLLSLSNMKTLVDRMAQRKSPLAPAPRPGA